MTKPTPQTEDAAPNDDALGPMPDTDETAAETEPQAMLDAAACDAASDDAAEEVAPDPKETAQADVDADVPDDEDDFGQPDDDDLVVADPGDDAPASDDGAYALHDRPGPDETQALIDHLRAAPADAPLVLDAAAVEATGTPYILALAAAARSRADAGAPAVLANPSAAVVDAFSDLGLFQDLMKMEFRP